MPSPSKRYTIDTVYTKKGLFQREKTKKVCYLQTFFNILFCRFFRRNCQSAVIITAVWTNSVSQFRLMALRTLRYGRSRQFPMCSSRMFTLLRRSILWYCHFHTPPLRFQNNPFNFANGFVSSVSSCLQLHFLRFKFCPHCGQSPLHSSLHNN